MLGCLRTGKTLTDYLGIFIYENTQDFPLREALVPETHQFVHPDSLEQRFSELSAAQIDNILWLISQDKDLQ
jgi:hypothetical protein